MSSKKKSKGSAAATQPAKKAAKKKQDNKMLIIGAVVVIAVVVGLFLAGRNSGGGAGGALTADPEEAKYIGRYLPAGYTEPKIGEGGKVTADSQMVPITASQEGSSTSIAVSDVTTNRVVGFSYTKSDGTQIPLIAYMKPSGKLVAAVSYCVPCKGTSHTLTTDGALTCDTCGTKRDAETGIGLSGPCKLYPLDEMPVTVQGDKIQIDNGALDGWQEQPTDRKVG